jgi:hypothetical protein
MRLFAGTGLFRLRRCSHALRHLRGRCTHPRGLYPRYIQARARFRITGRRGAAARRGAPAGGAIGACAEPGENLSKSRGIRLLCVDHGR